MDRGKKMKYYFYDTYGKDIVAYAHELKDKFTDIILNNYIPSPGVIDILKGYGLNVWIATKIYDESYILDIPRILKMGAGIALDAEPYSKSQIWADDRSTCFILDKLKDLIPMNTDILILPENLNIDKRYMFYNLFLNGMSCYYNPTVILELTYQKWLPWKIFDAFCNYDGEKIIGIWPGKFNWFCRWVQKYFSFLLADVMFYSEEREDWRIYS